MIDGLTQEDSAAFAAMQAADNQPAEEIEAELVEQPEIEAEEGEELPEAEHENEDGSPKPRRLVRHEVMHAERERRKAVEAENQRLREERARFDERLRVLQEIREQPAAVEEEEIPDPETDPIGAIRYIAEQNRKLREEREQQGRQTAEQRQQQDQLRQWTETYAAKSQEYEREDPASREAYSHFVNTVYQDMIAQGYPPDHAKAQAKQVEINVAHKAMQDGVNPRARIVEMAKARGWAPKAKSEAAAERVEQTRTAVERGKSLSGAGGGAATTEMTVERLLAMPDDEFHAWSRKNPAKARKLMGE